MKPLSEYQNDSSKQPGDPAAMQASDQATKGGSVGRFLGRAHEAPPLDLGGRHSAGHQLTRCLEAPHQQRICWTRLRASRHRSVHGSAMIPRSRASISGRCGTGLCSLGCTTWRAQLGAETLGAFEELRTRSRVDAGKIEAP